MAEALRARREDALLYRRLATLVETVPLDGGLDALVWTGLPRSSFPAFCTRLGLTTLQSRPERWREASGG